MKTTFRVTFTIESDDSNLDEPMTRKEFEEEAKSNRVDIIQAIVDKYQGTTWGATTLSKINISKNTRPCK